MKRTIKSWKELPENIDFTQGEWTWSWFDHEGPEEMQNRVCLLFVSKDLQETWYPLPKFLHHIIMTEKRWSEQTPQNEMKKLLGVAR